MKIMVINGPNLNMLGIREKNIYGTFSYDDLCRYIETYSEFKDKNIEFEFLQSNIEGEIVNFIQEAYNRKYDGIIINAGGYTHTSVAVSYTHLDVYKRQLYNMDYLCYILLFHILFLLL